MKLRYKYKLLPNTEQALRLERECGYNRFVWNHFLHHNMNEYAAFQEYTGKGQFVFDIEMSRLLTILKKEKIFLQEANTQTLQQTIRNLADALRKMKKLNRGFPQFKRSKDSYHSFTYAQQVRIISNTRVRLPKIGDIRFRQHRPLPCDPKTTTVYVDNGSWWISFVVEVPEIPQPTQVSSVVGIDLNSSEHVSWCGNNSESFPNIRFDKKTSSRKKGLQRKLSRANKDSKNRQKVRLALARISKRAKNGRDTFAHTTASAIAKQGRLVCMETLCVENMKQNHKTAIAIQDNCFASLPNMIEYKQKLRGGWLHKIGRYAPSSKTCSACGEVKQDLGFSKIFVCDSCGYTENRDVNAAKNIFNFGYDEFSTLNPNLPLPTRGITLVDVLAATLSSDMETADSVKQVFTL